ncbi:MAG TPA: hypothetical protein VFV74_05015 [Burkholderiales bacterium]|nr:hypothetical protein [Burkholderiales bacterium]
MTPNPMQPGSTSGAAGEPNYGETSRQMEDAEQALQSAKRQLADVLDGITERAREYGRYADEQVQANPWTAVGVGFGVGMAMGMLLAIVARR